MKLLKAMAFVLLAGGLVVGQESTSAAPASGQAQGNLSQEVKALRDALAQQQREIAQQQREIQELTQRLATNDSSSATPRLVDASLNTAGLMNVAARPLQDKPKESPLSFRIGAADFTPGGYVDFENIFRSTNTGNVAGTNFWAIPFSNTANAHLTEYRSTGQYSGFNIKVHTKYGENAATGLVEFTFNGNPAAKGLVTANPTADH